ncbi:E3 ubiquitin-protein ligase TRIM7-like isoform X2 [Heteronotia binoei]|uniref:E3 ubiquitin-protein ligase TRIM7-like isoform X2 n=1 Tax=Heteronotia binoei TaxID=13085 RepID=UPI00292E0F6F|nr:E3 ubiquitin-protein ligase TRIM7-like isoform X2 [Heteronotia binoei]
MAAEDPVQELREEASCSICLDFFSDPVTIAECGHNFCQACLTRSWGEAGAQPSCPQCRGRAQKRKLRPNQLLANFVEIIKKLRSSKETGRVCEKHQEPLEYFCKEDEAPLCLICGVSQAHKDHQVLPLEEAIKENTAVVVARKGRVCQKHQEPLKLFCKDDEALICVVCDRSKEHRDHETLPLEEASQEYKDQFCSCLEILKKKRERIAGYRDSAEKESQDLLKQTTEEKQKTLAKFRQLHVFLEEQEKHLLTQMEEVEKEIARNRDQQLARLSEELSSLESLMQEMEEKSQQPSTDLLQDIQSTMQRYEEKERSEKPVTFPLALKWRIWDFRNINHLLERVRKQLQDNLDSGLHLQKANVTLDPDTAHPQLILSEDWKSVREGEKAQVLPKNSKRFDHFCCVLGNEGFRAGHHFWEVLVGSVEEWMVGVAKKFVRRKGTLSFSPEEGFWLVGRWGGHYRASIKGCYSPLTLSRELKRIRVCLNYTGGRVAFFDAERAALLYEFSGVSFSGETLLPFFWVHLKGHLQLC